MVVNDILYLSNIKNVGIFQHLLFFQPYLCIYKQYSPFILEVIRSIWYEFVPRWNEFVPGWNEFVPGFSGIWYVAPLGKFENNYGILFPKELLLYLLKQKSYFSGIWCKFQKTLVQIHSILVQICSILEVIRTKWNELLPK